MQRTQISDSREAMAVGKVPPAVLDALLRLPRRACAELLVPPLPGEDAAVLRLGDRLVAVAADPVTFATPRPGFFAVHVNANDIAVAGAMPRYFTVTLLLPPQTAEGRVVEIMADALAASDALELVLLGGHTEVTDAVSRPVLAVTMFGELLRSTPVQTGGGRPGDALIQVQPLALEGTAILADEESVRLRLVLDAETVERAARFCENPGISVVEPAVLASTRLPVTAMHDPTEGGLATGLVEIAAASGTGLLIRERELLLRPETAVICAQLDLDPLGLISSGCLVLTVPPEDGNEAVALFRDEGFESAAIGCLTATAGEYFLEMRSGARRSLPAFQVDELARRAP